MNAHVHPDEQAKASMGKLCDILLSARCLVNAFDAIWTYGLIADVGDPILSAARDALDEAAEMADRLRKEERAKAEAAA